MQRGLATRVRVLIAGAALMLAVTGCGTKVALSTDPAGTAKTETATATPETSTISPSSSPMTSVTTTTTVSMGPLDSGALAALRTSQLPESDKAVSELMARMPGQVAGHPRTVASASEVDYADGSRFEALKLSDAAPGWTMDQFFARFRVSEGITVIRHGSDQGSVLWFVGDGAPPYHRYVAAFAARNGTWMYGLDAASAEAANQLINAATRAAN